MTQEEIKRDIQDGINSWDKTMNFGIPSFSLFYYTPNSGRNEDRNSDMNSIWDIKNGKRPIFGSKKVTKVLKHFFLSDTLSSLTFLCIPASKKWIYAKRYEEFSNLSKKK